MHENSINYHLINNKYILSQLPINLPSYTFFRKVPCTFLLHLSPPPLLQKEKEKRRKTFFHPFENHRINDVKVNRYIKRYTTNTAQHSASIKPDNRTNNRKGRGERGPSLSISDGWTSDGGSTRDNFFMEFRFERWVGKGVRSKHEGCKRGAIDY